MTKRRLRLSIRTRLTVLYRGLCLLAGVLLLAVNVLLFRHELASVKSHAKQRLLEVAQVDPILRNSLPNIDRLAAAERTAARSTELGAADHQLIISSSEAL